MDTPCAIHLLCTPSPTIINHEIPSDHPTDLTIPKERKQRMETHRENPKHSQSVIIIIACSFIHSLQSSKLAARKQLTSPAIPLFVCHSIAPKEKKQVLKSMQYEEYMQNTPALRTWLYAMQRRMQELYPDACCK